jgi:site-specific DNA-methyltransferase (adenine-specific)
VGPNPGYSYNAGKNGTTFHGEQGARQVQTAQKRGADTVESTAGRWPANVVLDDSQAAELDRQSRASQSRIGQPRGAANGDGWGMTATGAEYDYAGGASRFFPTFRYEPKAPTVERPRDGETAHPTVKPLDLMRWLVRLVTPPGGVVLEPFAGSGTTAEACVIEGFRCIAIEREPSYLPLIVARLTKPIQPDLFGGAA